MPSSVGSDVPFSRAWDAAAKDCGLAQYELHRTFGRAERVPLSVDGEPGVCLIRSGHLTLLGENGAEERVIRVVGEQELVGYGFWRMRDSPRYVLHALERGSLSYYPAPILVRKQAQSARLQELIIDTLVRTVLAKDERILALEEGSALQRVKSLLYSLASRFGERDQDGVAIGVNLSRVMMAKLASIAPANLSRILTDLVEAGIIVRRRRRIVVKDLRRVITRAPSLQAL